jgi:hypothetical protein
LSPDRVVEFLVAHALWAELRGLDGRVAAMPLRIPRVCRWFTF